MFNSVYLNFFHLRCDALNLSEHAHQVSEAMENLLSPSQQVDQLLPVPGNLTLLLADFPFRVMVPCHQLLGHATEVFEAVFL